MTKTKPMTDEWKDSLLRYCDVFDTKDGSYLNEHNVINFIEELLHQATSKAREEERNKIKQSVELFMNTHDRLNKSFQTDDFIKFVTEEI